MLLPRMTVRGSLKTMAIADVLDWIDRRGLVGELTLDRANTTRRFQLAEGTITGASSTNPSEYLGQLLVNAGALTEDDLREAYASQQTNGISLGKILMINNKITEQHLREAIELKIRESLYAAMAWDDGTFQFDPQGDQPRGIEVEVKVPLRAAMVAGEERAAAWRALHQAIPDDETRFFVPDPQWLTRAKPGSPSAMILTDVTRGLTVREIILERHALPFQVYQRLAELMQRGIIKIDRRAAQRVEKEKDDPVALVQAARGRAKGGDKAGALALARRALEAAPGDAEVKKAHHELERALFAELSRALLTRFRVPKLLKQQDELAALDLTAEERYLVGRIDGRWDLLSLMRVSPLREVEALITFKRLAERGVISLD